MSWLNLLKHEEEKKRGKSTVHVKVMCVMRRTIIRRMCLSSQGSLRSCLPPLLGWTLGKVLLQTTCSAFSCHSTSCDLQLLLLMVELWFWGTPQHLWGQSCTWKYISGFPDKISFIVPACALFQYPPPFLCYVCVLGGTLPASRGHRPCITDTSFQPDCLVSVLTPFP